jgi:hypothetical protein
MALGRSTPSPIRCPQRCALAGGAEMRSLLARASIPSRLAPTRPF